MDSEGGEDMFDVAGPMVIEPSWLAEQTDLLTLEEGFDRAMLSGAYICVGPGARTDPTEEGRAA